MSRGVLDEAILPLVLQALEIMQESHDQIDVVFMDIQMPIMRGDDATRLMRKWEAKHLQPGKSPLKIYACTGGVTKTDIDLLSDCGFDGFVSKPMTPNTLETILTGNRDDMKNVLLISHPSVSLLSDTHFAAKR